MRNKILIVLLLCAVLYGTDLDNSSERSNRLNVTCGDALCQLGENIYNCPEDCAMLPISYNTNMIKPQLSVGSSKTFFVSITNLLEQEINVSIGIEGEIEDYLSFDQESLVISGKNENMIHVTAAIPENVSEDNIEGEVVLETMEKQIKIPVSIRIVAVGSDLLEMDIFVLSRQLSPGENLKVQHEFYSYMNEPVTLNLTYSITDTEKVYGTLDSKVGIRGSNIFIKEINLTEMVNDTLQEGEYLLELAVDGKPLVSSSSFEYRKIFWTSARIRIAVVLGALVIGSAIFLFARKKFMEWKVSRMRYILPDFRTLPKKTDRSLPVGRIPETTKKAFLNPDDLTTHALVAGSTGAGKSVNASIIVEEILNLNVPAVVFDPTSQWTGFVKQCTDKNILNFYSQFGMGDEDAHSYKGLIYNITSPDVNIDIQKYMNPGEITVFNMNGLKPGEYDQAVQSIISKMFQVPWEESPELRMILVFDECHRLLEKYGGQGGYIALEKACREFRKWGIGLVMVSQVNADFKQAVAGNILTEVQLNTKSMSDINKMAQKYGVDYSSKITRMGIGVAMVQNPKYNDGKPWFIQFRPPYHNPHKIPEEELKKYSEYSTELDEIEEKIKKAEEAGKSTTDIRMELNLTRSKLKEGHFKMVDIYLNSLRDSANKL